MSLKMPAFWRQHISSSYTHGRWAGLRLSARYSGIAPIISPCHPMTSTQDLASTLSKILRNQSIYRYLPRSSFVWTDKLLASFLLQYDTLGESRGKYTSIKKTDGHLHKSYQSTISTSNFNTAHICFWTCQAVILAKILNVNLRFQKNQEPYSGIIETV